MMEQMNKNLKNSQTIIEGDVMNIYLIIMEGNYGAIDADDSTCHGYYVIRLSSSIYNLQSDFSIDRQIISSGEMVCEIIF